MPVSKIIYNEQWDIVHIRRSNALHDHNNSTKYNSEHMYNCSNQQPIHCAHRVNFHIFLVLFLLKVQTTRTDSTKIQEKIYTTNKKLPVSKTFKLTEPIW